MYGGLGGIGHGYQLYGLKFIF